jgi:magnesium chelatase family protein
MDRIDLQIELYPVSSVSLFGGSAGDGSEKTAARVAAARQAAVERWRRQGWRCNAEAAREALALPPTATQDLRHRIDAGALSARGFVRVLRVAWSVADVAGRTQPNRDDVNTALGLRSGGLG